MNPTLPENPQDAPHGHHAHVILGPDGPAAGGLSRIDRILEALLVALLAFMPLAFGAVNAWSEWVVVGLSGAMLACLAIRRHRGPRPPWRWACLPVGLLLLLAAIQLLPLPCAIVQAISPNTFAHKLRLLGDLPDSRGVLDSMTLSFYPDGTAHDLRMLLAVAAVFFVVLQTCRRMNQVRRLLGAITVIGAAVAALAVTQILLGADKIYGLIPTGRALADGGTFINHSHFSQFANLSIGAAVGLLTLKLRERFPQPHVTLAEVVEGLTGPRARRIWGLAAVIALLAASVILSLSRGGAISLLIAASLTAVLLAARRGLNGQGWVMAMVVLAAFVCVLYAGFDAVYDRLASLRSQHEYADRWQIVRNIAFAWTKFPLLGTGLGTHEMVYPMFDRSTTPAIAAHAENEYAQAAEETGLVGLALLAMFAVAVGRSYVACLRAKGRPACWAAYGLGLGLVAVAVHSLSDFGQHVPANACLTAVFCGLLVSWSRPERAISRGEGVSPSGKTGRKTGTDPTFASFAKMGSVPVFLATSHGPDALATRGWTAIKLAGIAIWAWAFLGAMNAGRAEASWRQALQMEQQLRRTNWAGSDADYAALISSAAAASDAAPGNVKYRFWLSAYRWQSISRPRRGASAPGCLSAGDQNLDFTRRIVDELQASRTLCPTFGPVYCLMGQLERFVLGRPVGSAHIRTGFELSPYDPTACYIAGLLDAREGDGAASLAKFQRALRLDGELFEDVVNVYIRQVGRGDLAIDAAGDHVPWLLHVAHVLDKEGTDRALAARAKARARAAIADQCRRPDTPAWVLATMADLCRQDRDYQDAASFYRRALAREYAQVPWRMALAHSLAEAGQVEQALHEADLCLRLRPQLAEARELIAQLHDSQARRQE